MFGAMSHLPPIKQIHEKACAIASITWCLQYTFQDLTQESLAEIVKPEYPNLLTGEEGLRPCHFMAITDIVLTRKGHGDVSDFVATQSYQTALEEAQKGKCFLSLYWVRSPIKHTYSIVKFIPEGVLVMDPWTASLQKIPLTELDKSNGTFLFCREG